MLEEEKKGRSRKKEEEEPFDLKKEIISWIQIIAAAVIIALVLNNFIIANSRVPSGSMENTIMTKSRVIGSRLSYLTDDPERGDIVIFHYPDDESVYYVKRVIGLPGETVEIVDGKVYINGSDTPLEEPYLPEPMEGSYGPYTVPEGSYFMLGDNRNNSRDARYWENKFVKKEKIIAKVLFCYYPLSQFWTCGINRDYHRNRLGLSAQPPYVTGKETLYHQNRSKHTWNYLQTSLMRRCTALLRPVNRNASSILWKKQRSSWRFLRIVWAVL